MDLWMIVSVFALLAAAVASAALMVTRKRLFKQITGMQARVRNAESRSKRMAEDLRRQTRERARYRRALAEERGRSDRFEELSRSREARCYELEQRIAAAEQRRLGEDKSEQAARMREAQLEKQNALLKRECNRILSEQAEQERIYQDIIRERDETIERLMGEKRKRVRRGAVLENQVTLDDVYPYDHT